MESKDLILRATACEVALHLPEVCATLEASSPPHQIALLPLTFGVRASARRAATMRMLCSGKEMPLGMSARLERVAISR